VRENKSGYIVLFRKVFSPIPRETRLGAFTRRAGMANNCDTKTILLSQAGGM
jgi:hypothetical protein